MTAVEIAAHFSHLTGAPEVCEASGTTLGDLINDLEKRYPGLARYLVTENGSLRRHLEILIDERIVNDREKLLDNVQLATKVVFRQTLTPSDEPPSALLPDSTD